MAIDPKILARMGASAATPVPTEEYLDGMTPLSGAPPVAQRSGLPTLVGTPKQIKWALTIREGAIALAWPPETAAMLRSIADSTWWIANKAITTTLKFKNPLPHQIVGGLLHLPPKGQQSGLSTPAPAATVSLDQRRLNDAILWAESVSRHPTLAQAAILSCLRFAYPKGEMRDQITAKARELMAQGTGEVSRDTRAIQLMLSKE